MKAATGDGNPTTNSTQQVDILKGKMLLAIQQGGRDSAGSIRKLIHTEGYNVDSEIGSISHGSRNKKAPKFHTGLTWASWQGNLSMVKCLLEEGADPNVFTSQGLAAIHCSTMKGDKEHLSVLKHLVEHAHLKTDINFCNKRDGCTPLMYASFYGSYDAVEYLLTQKAEVNRQDWEGKSALFYGARGGNLSVVQRLVEHDACVYLRDNHNGTVLHYLLIKFLRSKMTEARLIEIFTYLVEEKGLSVNGQMLDGSTALHEACRSGLTEAARFLINKGANLEAKRNGWETPFWTLVMGKRPRKCLMKLLQEKGAKVETRNSLGLTVFQYAKLVARNELLVADLEDVQKILRSNRMRALLSKRKEILSFGSTQPLDSLHKDSALKLLSPVPNETPTRWFEEYVKKSHNASSSQKTKIVSKPLSVQKHESKNILVENEKAKEHETSLSSVSSDSLTSESSEEDDDVTGNSITMHSSAPNLESETVVAGSTAFTSKSKINACDTSSIDSLSTFRVKEEQVVANENNNTISRNDRKIFDSADIKADEMLNSDDMPSSASFTFDRNGKGCKNVDCFERLLRKKRLLEEKGEIEDGEIIPSLVPQKIRRVRRSAVILSDSE